MKRIICLFIVFATVLSLSVGCTVEGLPEGMSGKDAVKVMLAKDRLDSNVLNQKGNIFDEGIEVMNNLAYITEESFKEIMSNPQYIMPENGIEDSLKNVMQFEEISNSYSYFESMTNVIKSIANNGANLIDYVKKNIRIVDTWISKGDEYYLHVDENSETLYSRTNFQVNMCKRYKNSVGTNVYEVLMDNEIASNRILYIPGQRFEFSECMKSDNTYLVLIADNSKGYWQMFTSNELRDRYNVSSLVMKPEVCCQTDYDSMRGVVNTHTVISSDKKTDILSFSNLDEYNSFVSVKLNGFDGVSSISGGSISFNNGVSLNPDTQVNDKVLFYDAISSETAYGTEAEIRLSITGTRDEKINALVAFINSCGLKCKRDLNSVINGFVKAEKEASHFINNYLFNGYSIKTTSGLANGFKAEKQKTNKLISAYNEIKDLTVIDYDRRANADFLINFAPITRNTMSAITYAKGVVSVVNLSLTIEDTTLFVTDEPYIVNFALSSNSIAGSAGLVLIELGEVISTTYNDTSSFTVSTQDISFALPLVEAGEYTLVTYISTSDGIRASEYIPVRFTSITEESVKNDNIQATISGSNDTLTVKSEKSNTIHINIAYSAPITYPELYNKLAEIAFVYGIPSDSVEMLNASGSYTELSPATSVSIAEGTYRMSYSYNDGASSDYVYVTIG